MSVERRARIYYRRLPDREQVFEQRILLERDDVIVTCTDPMPLEQPLVIDGVAALERGSRAVWFTFPGQWHDIGRFHRADGTLTGLYANILTPPRIEDTVWHTTDLFLDVWLPAGGGVQVLDEDELEEALALGHIEADLAASARAEADRLASLAASGVWPPPIVGEWTLAKALRTATS